MNIQALFGLSVFMSFVAFGLVTHLYIWPRLRFLERDNALISLVVPHTFRFIGLSFPGARGLFLPRYHQPSLLLPRTAIWWQPYSRSRPP